MSYDAGIPHGVGEYVGQVKDGMPHGQVCLGARHPPQWCALLRSGPVLIDFGSDPGCDHLESDSFLIALRSDPVFVVLDRFRLIGSFGFVSLSPTLFVFESYSLCRRVLLSLSSSPTLFVFESYSLCLRVLLSLSLLAGRLLTHSAEQHGWAWMLVCMQNSRREETRGSARPCRTDVTEPFLKPCVPL